MLVDRLIFLILPIFAIALPMMRVMPSIYAWRIRRRIYRWYGELKFLEQEMRACEDGQNLAGFLERLDSIEDRAFRRSLPLAFQNEMYTLREHIALVRTVIAKRMPGQTTG